MPKQEIEYIRLEKLHLDKFNPRLPSFMQNSTEEKIINWMLEDASILELMLAIGQNNYFVGEPLLVVKENDNYIVIEGNRRLTSLKLLKTPNLAQIHTKKIEKIIQESEFSLANTPNPIPCVIFNNREEISKYLGYRHITGVKSWSLVSKARYLHQLAQEYITDSIYNLSRTLAKKIGSRSDYVKRVLLSYEIYLIIEDNNFFNIKDLNETTMYFNYIADALKFDNIKEFINLKIDNDRTIEEIISNIDITNLRILIYIFFGRKKRVLGNSEQLKKLNELLEEKELFQEFISDEEISLKEIYIKLEISNDEFSNQIKNALKHLEIANSYAYKIERYNDSDIENLKNIVNLCKNIKNALETKDWVL